MNRARGFIDIVTIEREADANRLREELNKRAPRDADLVVRIAGSKGALTLDDPGSRVCVLLTKSSVSASDSRLQEIAKTYRRAGIPVLAAYQPREYRAQTPQSLHAINGFTWGIGRSPDRLATTLLRLVGLDERERRIFVSYRRGHGEQIARQLRYALIDTGWHVFLDTFSIEPGAEFQKDLFRQLDAMSLLLVIETPETRESQWVDDELAYASAHGVGIRALILPSVQGQRAIPRYADDQVFRVAEGDLLGARGARDRGLRVAKVQRWVDDLQADHTAAHRLRSEDMLSNAILTLGYRFGGDPRRVGEAVVAIEGAGHHEVVLATSRRPSFEDLGRIYDAMREVRQTGGLAKPRGWLVHRLKDPDPAYIRTLQRVGHGRRINVVSVLELDARLTP